MSALITIHELKTMAKVLQHEGCNDVMGQEMNFIPKNNTWTLQLLLDGKRPISSKWVYKENTTLKGRWKNWKPR